MTSVWRVTRQDYGNTHVAVFTVHSDQGGSSSFSIPMMLADEVEQKLRNDVSWAKIKEDFNKNDLNPREIKPREGA